MGFYWSYTLFYSSRLFLCALDQCIDREKNLQIYGQELRGVI